MTGADHYRKAEELTAIWQAAPIGDIAGNEALAAAQVHATLALAAATALGLSHQMSDAATDAWIEVA